MIRKERGEITWNVNVVEVVKSKEMGKVWDRKKDKVLYLLGYDSTVFISVI